MICAGAHQTGYWALATSLASLYSFGVGHIQYSIILDIYRVIVKDPVDDRKHIPS